MINWLYKRWRLWREGKDYWDEHTFYVHGNGTVTTAPVYYGWAFGPARNRWLEGKWMAQR